MLFRGVGGVEGSQKSPALFTTFHIPLALCHPPQIRPAGNTYVALFNTVEASDLLNKADR